MVTSFEQMVRKLGLSPEEYESSALLKDWVRRNMDEKYVPLDLLKAWGFEKDEATKRRLHSVDSTAASCWGRPQSLFLCLLIPCSQ